jgi:hypothetical protein
MINRIPDLIKKRRRLVVEECDVTKILTVINKQYFASANVGVGNCGWAETTRWFIHFDASKRQYERIKALLTSGEYGKIEVDEHSFITKFERLN